MEFSYPFPLARKIQEAALRRPQRVERPLSVPLEAGVKGKAKASARKAEAVATNGDGSHTAYYDN